MAPLIREMKKIRAFEVICISTQQQPSLLCEALDPVSVETDPIRLWELNHL
jgi:hypothetical protein